MKRILVLSILLGCASFAFAQNSRAEIREMTGTVELKTSGSAEWVPARPGAVIQEATIISTGFKSTAILAIGNSTLVVRPLTRMSLDALVNRDETETINVGLSTGRVRADIKPPAGGRAEVSVRTPTVTASVRGTVFDIDTAAIRVYEGQVHISPTGALAMRTVAVNAGQESRVESGKALSPAAAAETKLGLPALSGQKTGSHTAPGARLEPPRGSLEIVVSLESQ